MTKHSFDPEAFFSKELEPRLNAHPEIADIASLPAVVQLELVEPEAKDRHWFVVFENGAAQVQAGLSPRPSTTLRGHVLDWQDLLQGFASLEAALTDGRLEIEGDLSIGVRFTPLFFRQ